MFKYTLLTLGLLLLGCSPLPDTVDTVETTPEITVVTKPQSLEIETPERRAIEPEFTPQIMPEPKTPMLVQNTCEVFDDLTNANQRRWQVVNDNVMGGRSDGDFKIINNQMELAGSINLNGGGFTSVRAPLPNNYLDEFKSIKVRAKTDKRGYAITFREQNRQRLSHRLALDFKGDGEFKTAEILFTDLEPAYFGRTVRAEGFNPAEAREMGFILSDGQSGPYALLIDEISFCK